MMELQLTNAKSGSSTVTVSDAAFAHKFNESLVHQVVTAYLSGGRAGTHAQKTRMMVRGGGKKPWKQKGAGRARAGSIRSPIWRGGGKSFAAVTQDYSQKVNKKMYRGALRAIVSELARQGRLVVVEDFVIDAPKTKQLVDKLKALELKEVLIVTAQPDERIQLASRNLYRVEVCDSTQIDPVSLIRFDKVLVTLPALRRIEEWLA